MNRPAVTIIIPTYNRAHLIQECLASIFTQTFDDFEVLVVDDGSRDETLDALSAIKDPRLRVLGDGKNHGPGHARNVGLAAARGDWIAFQDSDDSWFPEKLKVQMDAVRSAARDEGAIYARTRRIEGDATYVMPHMDEAELSGDLSQRLLYWNFIPMHMAMVRRDIAAKAGPFDEGLPRGQDWDYWLRVAEHTRILFVDKVLGQAPVQPDSISADHDIHAESIMRILDRYKQRFDDVPAARAAVEYRLGIHSLAVGSPRNSRRFLRRSMKHGGTFLPSLAVWSLSWLGTGIFLAIQRGYRRMIRRYEMADR